MELNVYLSGEIHTDWRDVIAKGVEGLPVTLAAPNTDHEKSDLCGVTILGAEDKPFWQDRKGASMNSIRTRKLIQDADVVVVRFGTQYRQWNAAFDAGFAVANGKSLIVLHEESLTHALKEVDAAAQAVCEHPDQVVQVLKYLCTSELG